MTSKGKGNFTSKRLLLADALQIYIKQSLKKKKKEKKSAQIYTDYFGSIMQCL